MISNKIERSYYDEVYHSTLALYTALKEGPLFVVKRAEMKSEQVQALPIDFCADIEIKAKRTLMEDPFGLEEWWTVLLSPSTYSSITLYTREKLGKVFDACRLGPSGDYKALYFRVVNNRE